MKESELNEGEIRMGQIMRETRSGRGGVVIGLMIVERGGIPAPVPVTCIVLPSSPDDVARGYQAGALVRGLAQLTRWGRFALESDLRSKGVDAATIETWMAAYDAEVAAEDRPEHCIAVQEAE